MDFSYINLEFEEVEIEINKNSLKTKRKFAFLLDEGDILIEKINNLYANDEVEVVESYKIDNNIPKEKVKLYKIKKIERL
ncbi:hypothetical protein ACPB8Q_04340 [Methanocaldococcus indicus]|uniref:hypothetical protein n=1 Tax=Methanocaldococcus indicus TaxID=213231 RepID=UPI003C6D7172